jgi:integrase
LLGELPEHRREVVVFALSTGLRQGNVLGLTWGQVHLDRRMAMIEHGDTKNGEALGVPLNDIAMAVLQRQLSKHESNVFTFRGNPLRSANTRAWPAALVKSGIANFRWHDLRHTWASWLRQNDVPTWVLQELGGWKSETMVRRYAHMSVKHLQPYADRLIFAPHAGIPAEAQKTVGTNDTKSPTLPGKPRLYVVR